MEIRILHYTTRSCVFSEQISSGPSGRSLKSYFLNFFFFKAIFLLSLYAPLDSHESNPWLITDENLAQNTCAP